MIANGFDHRFFMGEINVGHRMRKSESLLHARSEARTLRFDEVAPGRPDAFALQALVRSERFFERIGRSANGSGFAKEVRRHIEGVVERLAGFRSESFKNVFGNEKRLRLRAGSRIARHHAFLFSLEEDIRRTTKRVERLRHEARRIKARAERCAAFERNAPVRRANAEETTLARGTANGAARIGRESDVAEPAGNGRGRP